jgi:hypothetical protein
VSSGKKNAPALTEAEFLSEVGLFEIGTILPQMGGAGKVDHRSLLSRKFLSGATRSADAHGTSESRRALHCGPGVSLPAMAFHKFKIGQRVSYRPSRVRSGCRCEWLMARSRWWQKAPHVHRMPPTGNLGDEFGT